MVVRTRVDVQKGRLAEQPKKIIELPEVKVVNALDVTITASIRLPEVSSMEKG